MMAVVAGRTGIDTEALKRERPLADVIASYGVTLHREGSGTYRGLCPFHVERTASFWVDVRDPSNEHYFCFGACGAHGDVITFVMERENCTFAEACEHLSTRGRPPLIEPSPRASKLSSGLKWEAMAADSPELEVLEFALEIYQDQLWRTPRAQAYLHSRCISEQIARSQRLGYADGGTLIDRLTSASLRQSEGEDTVELAIRLGLIVERPSGEDATVLRREFFKDRVVIPELRAGRPIWCIGRSVDDSTTGTDTQKPRPKYLGLPGEKPLLGLERIVGRRSVFLAEGPFDWLAAVTWDLPAFAICGTHFPAERMPSLADATAVYGLFDPIGRGAAPRSGSRLCLAADGDRYAFPTVWTLRNPQRSVNQVARHSVCLSGGPAPLPGWTDVTKAHPMLPTDHIRVVVGAIAEPDAEYRDAFLRAAGYLRIPRQEAKTLVELLSGEPFEQCGWAELEPAIRELQNIIDKLTTDERCRRSA